MAKSLHLLRGNFSKFTLFIIGSFLFLTTGWGQTVTTDKLDYAPGETAIITGEGWTGDQFVDLHFAEDPFVDHIHDYHDIVVNADGTFRVEFPILERHLGVTFTLTAEGKQTGITATRIFTDGNTDFAATGLPDGTFVKVNYTYILSNGNTANSSRSFTTPSESATDGLNGRDVTYTYPSVITVAGVN